MKKYEKPEMEVLILEEENVITTSILGDNNNEPGNGSSIEWNEWWKNGGN